MNLGLEGRHAWLGAASDGLGYACAHALVEEGCHATLVARRLDQLDRARNQLAAAERVRALSLDLGTMEGQVAACADIERTEPDILLLNTGGPPPGGTTEHSEEAWEHAQQLILASARKLTAAALPAMRRRRWGRIIAIASFTVIEPAERLALSNVFRTALVAYLKTLSREVAAEGITVNCVLPGNFLTSRLRQLIADRAKREGKSDNEIEDAMRAALPQRRFQDTADLAALVALLSSERGASITGTAIPVDGGMSRFLLG
ncbi:MAG: SDR family oxidoreductase [Kiritimatiellae bacterium]|nr:SDR family oxidoreductase [Kiritimatiellia bacterium]